MFLTSQLSESPRLDGCGDSFPDESTRSPSHASSQSSECASRSSSRVSALPPLPTGTAEVAPPRAAFDACTLRSWFIELDTDNNGSVTKSQFMDFLRDKPHVQNVLVQAVLGDVQSSDSNEAPRSFRSATIAQAVGLKRLMKLFRQIDVENSGASSWTPGDLQFEGFLEVFQRTGLLVTYATEDNPRDRMADVLEKEHHRRQIQAKWQKAGAQVGFRPVASADEEVEELNSNFLLQQKRRQVQAQWASDQITNLFKGRDAWSISVDACSTLGSATPVKAKPMACLESLHRPSQRLEPMMPCAPRCPSTRRSPRRARAS